MRYSELINNHGRPDRKRIEKLYNDFERNSNLLASASFIQNTWKMSICDFMALDEHTRFDMFVKRFG